MKRVESMYQGTRDQEINNNQNKLCFPRVMYKHARNNNPHKMYRRAHNCNLYKNWGIEKVFLCSHGADSSSSERQCGCLMQKFTVSFNKLCHPVQRDHLLPVVAGSCSAWFRSKTFPSMGIASEMRAFVSKMQIWKQL